MREFRGNLSKLIPILLLLVGAMSCVTSQKVGLSDISPRFAELENTDLDPFQGEKKVVPITSIPRYDGFFEQSRKTITTFQLGEKLLETVAEKQSRKESITREMEVALYLEDEFPSLIVGLPILISNGKEIQQNIENDFSGTKRGMLPQVGLELSTSLADLAEYSVKGPKIYSEIQRLRSDASNFSTASNKRDFDQELADYKAQNNITDDPETANPEDNEPESIEKKEPSNQTEKNIQRIPRLQSSAERTIQGDPTQLEIKRLPKRYSPNLGTQTRDGETPVDEKSAIEYERKLKEGLLQVFQAETRKNMKKLSDLTLHHSIPRVRAAGALALGRIKQGRWTLEKAIDKDGFIVRTAAYQALADIGEKKSVPYFIAGIKSEDTEIQAHSFLGLGKTRDPVGRELILSRGMTSDDVEIVSASLKGLGYYRIPSDLPVIGGYLSTEERALRIATIEALTIHNTPESLLVLENALIDHPDLTYEILDAIAKSKELAATFFLVRASQLYEDENVVARVGQLLLKRKAYGTYGMVMVREDSIRKVANERAGIVGNVSLSDVGKLNSSTSKRYVVRVGEDLQEDIYHNMTFENRIMGSKNRYATGWIFGKKIQLIQIKKPTSLDPASLKNLETGKFQNLYDPVETK